MKSNATVGAKVLIALSAVLLLTTIFSAYSSVSSIRDLNDRFVFAIEKTARKMELGGKIAAISSEMYSSQRAVIIAVFLKDAAREGSFRSEFEDNVTAMKSMLAEVRPLVSVPEGKRLLGVVEVNFADLLTEYREVARLCASGDPSAAQHYSYEKLLPIHKQLTLASAQFVEVYRAVLDEHKRQAEEQCSRSLWITLTAISLSLLCIGCGGVLTKGIIASIKVAAGELAQTAEQVSSASSQVCASSESLAQASTEQAASLEETSTAGEEMASMTRKNAENSQQAAEFVSAMNQRVGEANRTLAEMMTSMREIGESSGKISKIIKVIDEIAFQTNILALNAAVEAARAGEAGMGFAVVADEVRNLAQRSAQAAKDTAGLIEDSIRKSGEGSKKVGEVAGSIQAITEGAAKVKTLVDEVEASSKEQAQGIEQISRAILEMEQVTQKTAANAQESASAGEELNAQSHALLSVVERLQAAVADGSGQQMRHRAAKPTARRPLLAPHNSRRPLAGANHAPAPVPSMARNLGEFPLDDSEFKDF